MSTAKILDWDSDFFKFKIGRIDGEKLNECDASIELLNKQNVQLIYIFIPGVSEDKLNKGKYGNLMDVKFTYSYDLALDEDTTLDSHIHLIDKPSPKLYELAFQSGHESRYKKDPNFKKGEFERFYATWVNNSFNGIMADTVLGYYVKNNLAGFVTVKLKDNLADIGLIAVDTDMRSLGIGSKLINAAKTFATRHGAKILNVATQKDNIGACNFYEKNGFKLTKIESIYHKWFNL